MDWQQIAALAVVAITAVAFLRAKWRRRGFNFEQDTHCGCTPARAAGGSVIYSARKGQRPRIIVKHK